jgi:hypothetical protein
VLLLSAADARKARRDRGQLVHDDFDRVAVAHRKKGDWDWIGQRMLAGPPPEPTPLCSLLTIRIRRSCPPPPWTISSLHVGSARCGCNLLALSFVRQITKNLREEAQDVAVALGEADQTLAEVTGDSGVDAELGDDLWWLVTVVSRQGLITEGVWERGWSGESGGMLGGARGEERWTDEEDAAGESCKVKSVAGGRISIPGSEG